jgi:hypothetical protein
MAQKEFSNMASLTRSIAVVALVAVGGFVAGAEPDSQFEPTVAFSFKDVDYFHRWSGGEQHEFTPKGQEDLEAWTDMLTVDPYPSIHDGDGLANAANLVLENYKDHGAKVIGTSSVPRTKDKPAEHLVVVMFRQPTFVEIVWARFMLNEDTGCAYVYSHRIYGEEISEQVNHWLQANGPVTEKALMTWDSMPALDDLSK